MEDHTRHYEGCTRAFGALALAHRIVSAEIEKALAAGVSLSINEFDVLVSLNSRPENSSPLASLAPVIRLSQPAISRLIDRMVRKSLIDRLVAPEDRRSVMIRLTDAGRELLKKAVPIHDRCIREKLLACLTVEEGEVLRKALLKIADANGPPLPEARNPVDGP